MSNVSATAGDPLRHLAGIDPAGLPASALVEELVAAARYADQLAGEILRLLAELDASGGGEAVGCASTTHFVRQFLRMLPHNAGQTVETARALRRREATRRALADGTISLDHATVITQATEKLSPAHAAAAEPVLIQAAAAGDTPDEVRTQGSAIRHQTDPAGARDEATAVYRRRYASITEQPDGSWWLRGRLDAATGLVAKTAIEAFAAPTGGGDTRTPGQRRADGLGAACQSALDSGTLGERHEVRPHVNLVVTQATLAGEPGAPPATTGYRTHLTAEAARGLTCDATVSRIGVDTDGLPVDVGRAVRVITPALRRAIETRDQGCRWPACNQPATWTTPHHIQHFAQGGQTRLDNLILLCFAHHMGFVHSAGWTITGQPDSATHFTSPDGRLTLTTHPPGLRRPEATAS